MLWKLTPYIAGDNSFRQQWNLGNIYYGTISAVVALWHTAANHKTKHLTTLCDLVAPWVLILSINIRKADFSGYTLKIQNISGLPYRTSMRRDMTKNMSIFNLSCNLL